MSAGNLAATVEIANMLAELARFLQAFARHFPSPAPASSGSVAPDFRNSSVTSTNIPQTSHSTLPPVVDGINQISLSNRVDSTIDIKPFKLSKLEEVTNNFSKDIHRYGNFVYKGKLKDREVAIKKHDSIGGYMVRDGDNIQDKIDMVSKLNHKNIVRPLGYCHVEELNTFYFVEDYMPGSMDKFIKGLGADWSLCFQIIKGIAQGVQYLHERHIVHLNLKPSIILLDSNMNPKIGDSLLYTRLDHGDDEIVTSTDLTSSIDYIALEYKQGIVSTKSDMYPFGVILLEISSRMCKSKSTPRDVKDLPGWAWNALGSKGMEKLLHPSLRGNKYQLMEIERCMKVGLLCVQRDRKERPTMVDVLAMLNGEKEAPNPKKPAKLSD